MHGAGTPLLFIRVHIFLLYDINYRKYFTLTDPHIQQCSRHTAKCNVHANSKWMKAVNSCARRPWCDDWPRNLSDTVLLHPELFPPLTSVWAGCLVVSCLLTSNPDYTSFFTADVFPLWLVENWLKSMPGPSEGRRKFLTKHNGAVTRDGM
jgi:hypothetical protein